jgi:hypothetical protein
MKRLSVVVLFVAGLAGAVLLAGCPNAGLQCQTGLVACGSTCADIQNDAKNCGGCGIACGEQQACVPDAGGHGAPACVCLPGASACGGACVVTSSDPNNCGGCAGDAGNAVDAGDAGQVCESGQVCQEGQCQTACTLVGTTRCPVAGSAAGSCVDLQTDPFNCGSCGNPCPAKESCHSGTCRFDVLAACASVGDLVGVNASTLQQGAPENVAASPNALATYQNMLLNLVDLGFGVPGAIFEHDLTSLAQFTEAPSTNLNPAHLLVDGNNVYVTNAFSGGLLQVYQVSGADAGASNQVPAPLDGGLGLRIVQSISLSGAGTPEYMTKLGDKLYVTLYDVDQVVPVDVSNPLAPDAGAAFDLTTLNLNLYSGAPVVPTPWGITTFQGQVYVALQNAYYDSSFQQQIAGDGGFLAVLSPDGGMSVVDVGSDVCLVPSWLAPSPDGTKLFVGCAGKSVTTGSPYFTFTGLDRSAVLTLNSSNQRTAVWNCQTAKAVPGSGCGTFSANVFDVRGTRLYVGDNAFGRLLVLDSADGGLAEVAGFGPGASESPLQVCPINPTTGNSNISYVLSVP